MIAWDIQLQIESFKEEVVDNVQRLITSSKHRELKIDKKKKNTGLQATDRHLTDTVNVYQPGILIVTGQNEYISFTNGYE